jgi:hypothetical protein
MRDMNIREPQVRQITAVERVLRTCSRTFARERALKTNDET